LPYLQHFPLLCTQSKGCSKVPLLGISLQVVCGATGVVHKAGEPLFDNLIRLVALHIDVLSTQVVLTVACWCSGCWGVRNESGRVLEVAKDC